MRIECKFDLSDGVPTTLDIERTERCEVTDSSNLDFTDEVPTEPCAETSGSIMATIATSERPTVRMRPLTKANL